MLVLCCIMSSLVFFVIQYCNLVVFDVCSFCYWFVVYSDILGKSCGFFVKVISLKEYRWYSVCVEFSRGIGFEG